MKKAFKKIELLVHHLDRSEVVDKLQELGVVHLKINEDYRNDFIDILESKKTLLSKALEKLKTVLTNDSEDKRENTVKLESVEELANEILSRESNLEKEEQQLDNLQRMKEKYQLLGHYDREKVKNLNETGVHIEVYVTDKKSFENYDFNSLVVNKLSTFIDSVYFAIISHHKTIDVPFEGVQLPELSMEEVETEMRQIEIHKKELKQFLISSCRYILDLRKELADVDNRLQLLKASGSFGQLKAGMILHLLGWYPLDEEAKIVDFLVAGNWSYRLSLPSAGDNVPVLLKNKKYPKLFESITNIFQLPSYYEMDLTPLIAVFYPILFAYCLGDAGYGLILLSASIIGLFTFLKDAKNMAVLGIILGTMTTLMGLVKSGSVFGLPTLTEDSNAFFSYLGQFVVIPDDRSVVFNAFNVALMIGVIQILVAIVISIINKIRYQSFLASVSQIGKLLIVFNLIWIFLAEMQGVEALQPFQLVRTSLLIGGVVLVLFFHDLSVSIITRPFSGILPLFFILTGILGDVLSYVRLFALGVASSVLGLVVNQIGVQIMGDTWWQFIIGILFLLIGHGLNLALATLGAFVHPLRLTFVEFYNNAQFEGGGVAYKPFKKSNLTS